MKRSIAKNLILFLLVIACGPTVALAKPGAAQQQNQLITFNGYYALNNAPGAFFYVDTNMYVFSGDPKPIYSVSLNLSLDGKTSKRLEFHGRFNGSRLTQQEADGTRLDLIFERIPKHLGPTARVHGIITYPDKTATAVTGFTYANPIPVSFWGGRTYYATGTDGKPTAAAKLEKNGTMTYDGGTTGNPLQPVKSYRYNLDMYYFALDDDSDLIMGTAGTSGLTSNNLMPPGSKRPNRTLLTIPNAPEPPDGSGYWYPKDATAVTLADYSGYYSIGSHKYPKAFVTIEGKIIADPLITDKELYRVLIAVSLDGRTVESWYYDTQQMSFCGNVLRMPEQGITLRLNRHYHPRKGTFFNLSGKIKKHTVQGSSSFNTVPLSAFFGTMQDKTGTHTLSLTNTGFTLDKQTITNYEYVPTMYILAGPLPKITTVLSLGYDGAHGKTAIITTGIGSSQVETFNVYAIP